MTSPYRRFSRDVIIAAVTNISASLSGLATLPIVSKTLGTYNYGLWGQMAIILTLVLPITTLGLPIALVRYISGEKDPDTIRERFYSTLAFVLGMALVVALILFALSNIIGNALFDGDGNLIRIICLAIPFNGALSVFVNYLRAFRHMKLWSTFSLLNVYVQVALITVFVLTGFGITGLAYALLGTRLILAVAAGLIIIPKLGFAWPRFVGIRERLRFGIPTIPQGLSSWVVNAADRWVIGGFLGATFVGYYIPSYALGEFIRMFFFPLALLLPPVLSKFYDEGNLTEVKTHLRYSMKYFLMFGIPAAVGISMLAKPLLQILSTSDIAANGAFITPVVSAGMLLYGVYAVYLQVIFLVKKTGIVAWIWVVAAGANLGLNLGLVPHFGIMAAAVTTLFSFGLALGLTAYFASREITFSIDVVFIIKSLLASALMGGLIWLVKPEGSVPVVLMVAAGAAVYFILLFLMRAFSKNEISFARQLLGLSR